MLALRLPFVVASGTLVTLSVFALLFHFVSVPLVSTGSDVARVIEFSRMIVEVPAKLKRDEKTQRPDPPQIPDPPQTVGGRGTAGPPTQFQRASFSPGRVERSKGVPLRPDGDAIPIVRPQPDYPPGPLAKGEEGWVQVRFNVSTVGTVKDAVVVEAEPHKTFDNAALKAIARWRYNPKIEDGVAVERVGLQAIIRFEISK